MNIQSTKIWMGQEGKSKRKVEERNRADVKENREKDGVVSVKAREEYKEKHKA